ncbi:uncharacterized protein LOC111412695 [Olea europaea var. sylvestris]|uniref:uncharacterized protein LOC111412695 n=1 Tax=Olea europaea var. sylvestris TaxID=158386 RepID=UPI000C1D1D9B|nr:uncharacterized protein LOC111412695 [Olea europaea var. sylvestris]
MPIGMSPYCLLFGKSCHLPVEPEHRVYWPIKAVKFDVKLACEKRLLQLNELDEARLDSYENAQIYKEKSKKWHDKHIVKREFFVGQQVILYNSRLQLFPEKLCSRWSGPFTIAKNFPHGAVELHHEEKENFKVNEQRLKPFGGDFSKEKSSIPLTNLE